MSLSSYVKRYSNPANLIKDVYTGISDLGDAAIGKTAADEAAAAQKKAYEEQLTQMEKDSQWGFGYPKEITDALLQNMKAAGATASEMQDAYDRIKNLYSTKATTTPIDMSQYGKDVNDYVAKLNQGGTVDAYKSLAKDAWNQSFQALNEVPGMTSGQRIAAMSGLTSKYGQSLTAAGIQGEEDRVTRAGLAFNAQQGFDTASIASQEWFKNLDMQSQQNVINAMQQYGQMGVNLPGAKQSIVAQGITTASNLQSRYPGTISAPLDAPSTLAILGPQIGQAALTYLGYNAAGVGTSGAVPTSTTNLLNQEVASPYLTLQQKYIPQTTSPY
jgi:hypothetical protein